MDPLLYFNHEFLTNPDFQRNLKAYNEGQRVPDTSLEFLKYTRVIRLLEKLVEISKLLDPPTPTDVQIISELFSYEDDVINRINLMNWCKRFLSHRFQGTDKYQTFLEIIDENERMKAQAEYERVQAQTLADYKREQAMKATKATKAVKEHDEMMKFPPLFPDGMGMGGGRDIKLKKRSSSSSRKNKLRRKNKLHRKNKSHRKNNSRRK